jgi:spore germination protein GerM
VTNFKSGTSFWWVLIAIIVVLAGTGLGINWFLSSLSSAEPVVEISSDGTIQKYGRRTISLAYIDNYGSVSEHLTTIESDGEIEADLIAILNALTIEPENENLITAIPIGTNVLAAFYDANKKSAVIDFSTELVSAHPGGTAAEHATIDVIMTTVARNFPEIDTCLLLVDKAQCETLAGHIEINRSFKMQEWR